MFGQVILNKGLMYNKYMLCLGQKLGNAVFFLGLGCV